jgi:glutathione S-transferase
MLRIADIKYKLARVPALPKVERIVKLTCLKGNPRTAPKRKLPFIQLPSGEKLGDSTLCYNYLRTHHNASDIDASLTPLERAQSAAYRAWMEDWLYFLGVWDKWIDNWYETRETLFAEIVPFYPLRVVVFNFIYRDIAGTLWGKGIMRHSREEIVGMIADGFRDMSVLVGDKGFFDGKPCSVNAYLGALIVCLLEGRATSKNSVRELEKYPNLKKLAVDWAAKYFPERKLEA